MRVLILGGTTEASALAVALAQREGIEPVLSLAGRTERPVLPDVAYRIGGFGGADGLASHLRNEAIDAVVDATHPFAGRMCWNAAAACEHAGVPLLRLGRPAWVAGDGDLWVEVASIEDAVAALGEAPRRVFLTVGRLSLPAFGAAPQHHYLVRSIDAPDDLSMLPDRRLLLARGPFGVVAEETLMRDNRVEVVVTKNSGGTATAGKIEAARRLRLPVVMVARPPRPALPEAGSVEDAVEWLQGHRPRP
jgi:precorrin-6A/cobalt-precorrin-6A reductase